MIDYAQARQIALAHIGPDCGLMEEVTLEKSYGWYFYGQSQIYLQTRDMHDILFGSGGFIVERENGRIFEFGSAYPPETWIANYEKGFKYNSYDLVVTAVHNLKSTVDLLFQLGMRYVVPEVAHGVKWKISRYYRRIHLYTLLHRPPCTFSNQAFWNRVEVFDKLNTVKCCTYELREHRPE